jgi:hypothetical protein
MPQPKPGKSCINAYGTPVFDLSSLIQLVPRVQVESLRLPKSYIVIHTSIGEHLEHILSDMLIHLDWSGLYDDAEAVTIAASPTTVNTVKFLLKLLGDKQDKVNVIEIPADTWELSTLQYLHRLATNLTARGEDAHMLYIHTEGLNLANGDYTAKWFWRKFMEHWVVRNHRLARYLLELGYDTVGSNPINFVAPEFANQTRVNPEHSWHYSGNFWWSTAKFISSMPMIEDIVSISRINDVTRLKAETYVLSKLPNMCAGILSVTDHKHLYQLDQLSGLNVSSTKDLGKLIS